MARAVLPSSVAVTLAPPDLLVVNGTPLRVAWASDGWLSDVAPIIGRRRGRPKIVFARRLSPGARSALAEARIGWADETGAAEIAIGSIVVAKTGVANVPTRPTGWTAATVGVAEAVLCGVHPTVDAAVDATGLSTGSCVAALRLLTDLGLLAAAADRGRGSGRRVADRDRLLDAYATAAIDRRRGPSIGVGVAWRDLVDGTTAVGRRWTKAGIGWAATGLVASVVMAPFLTNVGSADVYVEARSLADLAHTAEVAGLVPMEGGRLRLTTFPTPTTQRLAEEIDGLMVAPWPRVFADLRVSGVRGEDAAEHLREVRNGH